MHMRKFTAMLSILTVWLLFLPACAGSAQLQLDNTATFAKCRKGDTVKITLDGNPSTGYRWDFENESPYVVELESEDIVSQNNNLVGAPARQVFLFSARKAGKSTIVFKYRRPWEKAQKPVFEVVYTIVVE